MSRQAPKSPDKSFDKSMKNPSTFLNIPLDVFFHILRKKIKRMQKSGLIIESLESTFISSPVAILHGLLNAVGNAQYVLVVVLHYSIEAYIASLPKGEEFTDKKKRMRSGK